MKALCRMLAMKRSRVPSIGEKSALPRANADFMPKVLRTSTRLVSVSSLKVGRLEFIPALGPHGIDDVETHGLAVAAQGALTTGSQG
jgi:hypothetical protein